LDKKELWLQWLDIEEVMRRKSFNIYNSVDLYTTSKKVYTFNLCTLEKCDEFIALCK